MNKQSRARPMRFVEMEGGCIVALSHSPNKKGYLSKSWWIDGERISEPFHRFIFRARHNLEELSTELEVDHMCENRACCNVNHLRLLDRQTHQEVTNRNRYSEREAAARLVWRWHNCTGEALAETFGVSASAANRWIKRWTNEQREALEAASAS